MSKEVSSSGNTEMAAVQERVRRRLPLVLGHSAETVVSVLGTELWGLYP